MVVIRNWQAVCPIPTIQSCLWNPLLCPGPSQSPCHLFSECASRPSLLRPHLVILFLYVTQNCPCPLSPLTREQLEAKTVSASVLDPTVPGTYSTFNKCCGSMDARLLVSTDRRGRPALDSALKILLKRRCTLY